MPSMSDESPSTTHRRRAAEDETPDRGVWQAEIYPLPGYSPNDLHAIPVLSLVCGESETLHCSIGFSPGAQPEVVAASLADAVGQAIESSGRLPDGLEVRHAPVAGALGGRLADAGIDVRACDDLRRADQAARSLIREMADEDAWPPTSAPMTWAAWGHPPERIAELFEAANHYVRAEPWRHLYIFTMTNRITLSDGRSWYALASGHERGLPGIKVTREERDVDRRSLETRDGGPAEYALGPSLHLHFDPATELPRPMRREVADAGWTVGGPSAYPYLLASRTPGGGITSRDLEDLRLTLLAYARRAAAAADGTPPDRWVDPESGLILERATRSRSSHGPSAWDIDAPLHPGGPAGPGADLASRVTPPQGESVFPRTWDETMRYASWLQRSPWVTMADDRIENLDEVELLLPPVVALVRRLADWRVPLVAFHEHDLYRFLAEYPMGTGVTVSEAVTVLDSLRPFFEYLRSVWQVACPWADAILDDRAGYESIASRVVEAFPIDMPLSSDAATRVLNMLREHSRERGFVPGPEVVPGTPWRRVPDATEVGPGRDPPELPGPTERELKRELEARWLVWREELIVDGVTSREELLERLTRRKEQWARERHPRHGLPPLLAVGEERAGA